MTQADHYRDQSDRARRLAEAAKDPEASKKLFEMSEEFRLYAERLDQTRSRPPAPCEAAPIFYMHDWPRAHDANACSADRPFARMP